MLYPSTGDEGVADYFMGITEGILDPVGGGEDEDESVEEQDAPEIGSFDYGDLALGVAQGALSIMGGNRAAKNIKAEARIRSEGHLARAVLHRYRASLITTAGRFQVAESKRRGVEVLGEQTAARGAQGVTMSGSALDVLLQTASDARRNTSFIEFNVASAANAEFYYARLAQFASRQEIWSGRLAASDAKKAGILGALQAVSTVAKGIG